MHGVRTHLVHPSTPLSVRSRTYLSWLILCSEATPESPPSLHHCAGREEFPLIWRLVAEKHGRPRTCSLPCTRASVWTATRTKPLGPMLALEQPDSRQNMYVPWNEVRIGMAAPSTLRNSWSQHPGQDARTGISSPERGQKTGDGASLTAIPQDAVGLPWSGRNHTLTVQVSLLSEPAHPE